MTNSNPTFIVYNTLTRKKQKFTPQNSAQISIYGCGPTVYDLIHIGNARAFLVQDLIVRSLEYFHYPVRFARNYTDIDDKIIQASHKQNLNADELAQKYIEEFDNDMAKLAIRKPDFTPKVTENLKTIIEMIEKLIKNNHAYLSETKNGQDVYYAVDTFKNYGKLANRKLDELDQRARIESSEVKKNSLDFALWKAAKPDEPSWPSPWGNGRPGWHIECSAMIDALFEDRLDIHLGGADLIFPHHENEIAQSEGTDSKPLANYWLHNGMVQIDHVKMSKSLGNIIKLRDFLDRFGAETLRLTCYQTHYRQMIDISKETISRSEALLTRLYQAKNQAKDYQHLSLTDDEPEALKKAKEAILQDFNSAKALGELLKFTRLCYKTNSQENWAAWNNLLNFFNDVFGILQKEPKQALNDIRSLRLKRMGLTSEKADEVENLIKQREVMRQKGEYQKADEIRDQLVKQKILVMDGPDGASWDVEDE